MRVSIGAGGASRLWGIREEVADIEGYGDRFVALGDKCIEVWKSGPSQSVRAGTVATKESFSKAIWMDENYIAAIVRFATQCIDP